jgi:hypothetical protein
MLFMALARKVVRPEFLKALGLPALMAVIPILSGTVFHLGFWASVAALVLTYLAVFIWRWRVLCPVMN